MMPSTVSMTLAPADLEIVSSTAGRVPTQAAMRASALALITSATSDSRVTPLGPERTISGASSSA